MDTLFIIILISCAVAGLICLGLYNAMKPVSKKQTAAQYVSQERLVLNINEDNFLRETESRQRITNQAVPGMAAGSAGATPGQNMTISASAPGTPVSQQHTGGFGPGGNTIHLGGGGNTINLGGNGNTIHLGGARPGQQVRPGNGTGAGQQGGTSAGTKPGNVIDLGINRNTKK